MQSGMAQNFHAAKWRPYGDQMASMKNFSLLGLNKNFVLSGCHIANYQPNDYEINLCPCMHPCSRLNSSVPFGELSFKL